MVLNFYSECFSVQLLNLLWRETVRVVARPSILPPPNTPPKSCHSRSHLSRVLSVHNIIEEDRSMRARVSLLNRCHKNQLAVINSLCLAGYNGCLLPLREVETLVEEGLVRFRQ